MVTSSPPALSGTVCIRQQAGRLWVSWQLEGGTHTEQLDRWGEMRADWRRTFPRHSDAGYSHVRRAWSVPLRQRGRLLEWAAAWGLALVGDEDEHE